LQYSYLGRSFFKSIKVICRMNSFKSSRSSTRREMRQHDDYNDSNVYGILTVMLSTHGIKKERVQSTHGLALRHEFKVIRPKKVNSL
jgi:hypothetical protein